ncbi:MAG: hypothetical protein RBG1_1C00001G0357 [candidate division Zixibacteria bacterium RBG-1]|nr:MAG: hypothetical protein RBG1_1C00001G0357 [candidate division Zixibacteria bacterium RBG-1]OGC84373.1 MAG: hypothetical protein A2V73_09345 [candidate division Zixibacteria bacterium RBG_19FT_COMBO_42_43]
MQPNVSLILFYLFSFILLLSGLFYIYAKNFKVKSILLSLNSLLVALVILFFKLPLLAFLQVIIFVLTIPFLLCLKNKKMPPETDARVSNHLVAPGFLISLGLFLVSMYILSRSKWRGFGPPEEMPPSFWRMVQDQFILAIILIGLAFFVILAHLIRKKNA